MVQHKGHVVQSSVIYVTVIVPVTVLVTAPVTVPVIVSSSVPVLHNLLPTYDLVNN